MATQGFVWCERCALYHPVCRYCGKVLVYLHEQREHPCTLYGRVIGWLGGIVHG